MEENMNWSSGTVRSFDLATRTGVISPFNGEDAIFQLPDDSLLQPQEGMVVLFRTEVTKFGLQALDITPLDLESQA